MTEPAADNPEPGAARAFREAIHQARRFYTLVQEQIAHDPGLDEHERKARLEQVTTSLATLDEWEKRLGAQIQEGMDTDTQLALLLMAKRLRVGLEDL